MTLMWAITAAQSRSLTGSLNNTPVGDSLILFGPDAVVLPAGIAHVVGAMFLHVSISHLAMNLFMLLLIGREIERYFSPASYLVIFLTAGVGASAAVLWQDFASPTAGASGAIYGLMAVLVGIAAVQRTDLRGPIALVLVNLAFTFITPGISQWGHLGGLLTGFALLPAVRWRSRPAAMWTWIVVVTAAVWGLVLLRAVLL